MNKLKPKIFNSIEYLQQLDWSEITNDNRFEALCKAYFETLTEEKNNQIDSVEASAPAEGADGGQDLIVTFGMSDGLSQFARKWVVQCKFESRSVGKSKMQSVNIPALIHQYGAVGYLLICKTLPTTQLEHHFEDLKKNCRFEYKYEIWTGDDFLSRILEKENIVKLYFPKYYAYIQLIETLTKGIIHE